MFSLWKQNNANPQDIYCQQWIKHKRDFETEMNCFNDQLQNLEKLERFEILQEANMGGTYLRCFFKLKDNETIFEDVAFRQPYLKMDNPDLKWTIKLSEKPLWDEIKEQFTIEEGKNRFILVFTRKIILPVSQSQHTH
jgi:hypothetical protein